MASCGVNITYLKIFDSAFGSAGSLNLSTCNTRCFSSEGERSSFSPSSLNHDSFGSWLTPDDFLFSVRLISYLLSSTVYSKITYPCSAFLDNRDSGFCEPKPNKANSIDINTVDLPEPISPSNNDMPL